MVSLSPIESEFASTEEAEAYDHWLRAKVIAALNSKRPKASHDEAMAQARKLIERNEPAASDLER